MAKFARNKRRAGLFYFRTLNSYDLIYKFSEELGSYLLDKGYDFIIFGNLKTLKKDSKNFLDYIASSPYIVSQILYTMIRGFEASGIFPIIYLEKDFNNDIKNSLEQKGGELITFQILITKIICFMIK
ncbi:hypothetical protein [Marinitoga lauensis]|uniref:hypothetical protein n=1 Tax=Marinitoga lauensis TaxID=2201189 RepID=UPI0014045E71|nr:hypothetical protein [Marinitoga lauensis]